MSELVVRRLHELLAAVKGNEATLRYCANIVDEAMPLVHDEHARQLLRHAHGEWADASSRLADAVNGLGEALQQMGEDDE